MSDSSQNLAPGQPTPETAAKLKAAQVPVSDVDYHATLPNPGPARHIDPGYLPIEDYGVIGDLHTTALVGLNGSIDFFCYPHFDSPSVFCRILDAEKGGFFQIAPDVDGSRRRQLYLPDSNVLLTRILSPEGIIEITDCMPVCAKGPGQQLIRLVRMVKGTRNLHMHCAPRFDYARRSHHIEHGTEGLCATFIPDGGDQPNLRLCSEIPLTIQGDDIVADFTLTEGESVRFHLAWSDEVEIEDASAVDDLIEQTLAFWRNWIGQSTYRGRWREQVDRSALVLKLLNHYDSGGFIAAATFGLPEAIGGSRNWDYRYSWIRDSAFTIYALMRLGFKQEAVDYMNWVREQAESEPDGTLHLMYRVRGGTDLEEETLDHLEGYRQSKPVRIGNAAVRQQQNDIYGELLDSVYIANRYVVGIASDGWEKIRHTVDHVCDTWQRPDHGIWEIRGTEQVFLHSRLMSWVAIDRGIRIARENSFPAPLARWQEVRDTIYESIFADFWDDKLKAFVQYKGGKTVDASTLMMPMVKFIAPTDPRWLSTLEAIGRELGTDALISRYNASKIDFEGIDASAEGSFTMCSFWYIECLARAGRVEEARLLFDKMLGYANHLGLYAEELGTDGAHLGNFPQAFTHLALISAAYAINLKLGGENTHAWRF